MSSTITDTLRTHLEQVSNRVQEYHAYDQSLAGRFKPTTVAEVTRYLYRIIVENYIGGQLIKYSADRGSMGTGTGPSYTYLTAGFLDSSLNFEVTKEQMDTMMKDSQARVKILARIMAQAMTVMIAHDNSFLFGDGTGVLTNDSSLYAAGPPVQYTFAAATDSLGVNRLFEGMSVDIWSSDLGTKRNTTGGPRKILQIDRSNKIVTLDVAPNNSPATGDQITVANVEAYGPSTPTGFSSTWPGGALTTAAGLTGDSWLHGLGYANDATTSNYYLGQIKSGLPKLIPPRVNASSATIGYDMIETMKNLGIEIWGDDYVKGLMGVCHMKQQQKLKEFGTTVVRDMATPSGVKLKDLQPAAGYADTFYISEVPHFCSRSQDRARIDYYHEEDWGRVESEAPHFYKLPDGGIFFELRNSSGEVLAGFEFRIVRKFDWVCHKPGRGGVVDTLAFA